MESNRDEADRCIEIALDAINNSNYEKAEKFLKKAEALYPTKRAEELLQHISKIFINNKQARNGTSNTRQRKFSKGDDKENHKTNEPSVEQQPQNYTKKQSDLVLKIKKCKNFYEVLDITKEATDIEIKKAYKKIALQLHPDKNHAPGSVEAFKAVGNAVATLTDAKKRKDYDLYGIQMNNNVGGYNHNHRNPFHQASGFNCNHHHNNHTFECGGSNNSYYERGFESEVSAEELFNMFFGGFPSHARRRQQHTQHHQQNQQEPTSQPIFAFGLIIGTILISILSSFFASDPIYSLAHTSKYNVARHTNHLGVPYFVKDNFADEYLGSLGRLESSVEEDYIHSMKQNCYRERTFREAMIARARSFGSKTHVTQAQSLKTPSCDNLAKIGLTRYSLY